MFIKITFKNNRVTMMQLVDDLSWEETGESIEEHLGTLGYSVVDIRTLEIDYN